MLLFIMDQFIHLIKPRARFPRESTSRSRDGNTVKIWFDYSATITRNRKKLKQIRTMGLGPGPMKHDVKKPERLQKYFPIKVIAWLELDRKRVNSFEQVFGTLWLSFEFEY